MIDRMNAEVRVFDENGQLYMAEKILITDLEIEHGFRGMGLISLSGRINDFTIKERTLNRKALIV